MVAKVTVITPTTGKDSLFMLIDSIREQRNCNDEPIDIHHIMLWDDKREGSFIWPDYLKNEVRKPEELQVEEEHYRSTCLVLPSGLCNRSAPGSALRSIGLMTAQTELVTFADDDIIWEKNHLSTLTSVIDASGSNWGYCMRNIWTRREDDQYEFVCLDDFESVGDESKLSYQMVDNNCMIFKRRYGTSAACLYRETKEYNDDRLMYQFLTKHAGAPAKTRQATVNQVCPDRLVEFFRTNGSNPYAI